ncbi:hypothetical protein [Candidatus Electronema sp. PJ]|uniref:hypothetical protein n=1 Tax=Candidatus Electronema sp. PJ TaxID=3401572 RepID=UPI003AA92498
MQQRANLFLLVRCLLHNSELLFLSCSLAKEFGSAREEFYRLTKELYSAKLLCGRLRKEFCQAELLCCRV